MGIVEHYMSKCCVIILCVSITLSTLKAFHCLPCYSWNIGCFSQTELTKDCWFLKWALHNSGQDWQTHMHLFALTVCLLFWVARIPFLLACWANLEGQIFEPHTVQRPLTIQGIPYILWCYMFCLLEMNLRSCTICITVWRSLFY